MFLRHFANLAPVFAFGVIAAPALADITPDDAWNTWKAQIKAFGFTLDANESRDGDALQIGEVTISAMLPAKAGSMNVSFDGPRFTPLGDGRVSVSFPDSIQASFNGAITHEGSIGVTGLVSRQNETAIMSGTPGHVTSRWSADNMRVELTKVTTDGIRLKDISASINFGAYWTENITRIGDNLTIDHVMKNDSFAMKYDFEADTLDGALGESGGDSGNDMSVEFSAILPLDGLGLMDMHRRLRNGFNLSYSTDVATYRETEISRLDGELVASQKTAFADYHAALSLDHTGLGLEVSTGPFVSDIVVGAFGWEISVQSPSAALGLLVPLLKSKSAQNANLRMRLQDLTINPELWDIIDSDGLLDRSPINFDIDLSGGVDVSTDLLDFDVLATLEASPEIFLPSSLEINTLLLSAMGAKLAGTGAFTFDKSDLTTYPGVPRPDGSIELRLAGGNALLDRLLAAGALPEEQVTGIRMMMSLFGKIVEGADALSSNIEMTKDGHVTVNGQRLK